ncbi:hypothetical protein JCGZ_03836 [Jatropha curcas]|uniref:Uncharacterized protein n=1 Tax=Jatropha curcas TaxID=180498 RepID=A0A067JKV2_JATCU|nr:hypothetical protein JCGZ_03836 [Jatropha curcas]
MASYCCGRHSSYGVRHFFSYLVILLCYGVLHKSSGARHLSSALRHYSVACAMIWACEHQVLLIPSMYGFDADTNAMTLPRG